MRRSVIWVVFGLFLALGGTRGEPPGRDDLRGSWDAFEQETAGKKKTHEALWKFHEGKLSRTFKGKTTEYTYRLDPSKNPRQITMTSTTTGKSLEGIYTLDGDVLKICYGLASKAGAGKPRPTTFMTASGDGNVLYTLKRKL